MLSWVFFLVGVGSAAGRQEFFKAEAEQDVCPGEEHQLHEVGDGDDEVKQPVAVDVKELLRDEFAERDAQVVQQEEGVDDFSAVGVVAVCHDAVGFGVVDEGGFRGWRDARLGFRGG